MTWLKQRSRLLVGLALSFPGTSNRQGAPGGWAIFAHCFTCGKDSRAAVYISRALSRAGIGVLRFDFAGTGIGGGTGEPVSFAARAFYTSSIFSRSTPRSCNSASMGQFVQPS